MGLLVDGQWHDEWYDTKSSGGRFIRTDAQFRNWITKDGSKGESGTSGFKAEKGRYHLYVSLACPWAHRTLIVRALKGLTDMISVSVVSPDMLEKGWVFDGENQDDLYGFQCMHQVYTKAQKDYSGRVTVPVLWDKVSETIVSNESSEIIRMFNESFDDLGATEGHFYPADLQSQIDAINARVYDTVNNGVYKSGFATTQEAYEEAVYPLFESLDWLEGILSENRYLTGDQLTEADIRLFTTLVRFDPVYHGHFKCNIRMIKDYPNLWAHTREIYQIPGVAETVSMDHIQGHYYRSHTMINPTQVVPVGTGGDLNVPHGRDSQFNKGAAA